MICKMVWYDQNEVKCMCIFSFLFFVRDLRCNWNDLYEMVIVILNKLDVKEHIVQKCVDLNSNRIHSIWTHWWQKWNFGFLSSSPTICLSLVIFKEEAIDSLVCYRRLHLISSWTIVRCSVKQLASFLAPNRWHLYSKID